MIDPTTITNFHLTDPELEEVLLFWVCAAGKNAKSSAKGLDKFLKQNGFIPANSEHTPYLDKGRFYRRPFFHIRTLLKAGGVDFLARRLKANGIGCYNHKARTMKELVEANLNLRTCSTDDLEKIFGIGMKTSRCFIMHSRPNARCAGLDTHILKYLRDLGHKKVPASTPSSKKKYMALEEIFLEQADKAGTSPAELDLMVWNYYSGKNNFLSKQQYIFLS